MLLFGATASEPQTPTSHILVHTQPLHGWQHKWEEQRKDLTQLGSAQGRGTGEICGQEMLLLTLLGKNVNVVAKDKLQEG